MSEGGSMAKFSRGHGKEKTSFIEREPIETNGQWQMSSLSGGLEGEELEDQEKRGLG